MLTILIIILVLALIGALPSWPYSSGWGYYPSGPCCDCVGGVTAAWQDLSSICTPGSSATLTNRPRREASRVESPGSSCPAVAGATVVP
jgi:hypothetical protein